MVNVFVHGVWILLYVVQSSIQPVVLLLKKKMVLRVLYIVFHCLPSTWRCFVIHFSFYNFFVKVIDSSDFYIVAYGS